jgi:hypothetical protein
MRSFSLLAVVVAVLSAGGAVACCLFKSTPGRYAVPSAPGRAVTPAKRFVPTAGSFTPYVEIETVGGKAPNTSSDPWQIPGTLPPGQTEVVVDVDLVTGRYYPVYVYLEDLGLLTATKTAATTAAKYFWHDWSTKEIVLPFVAPVPNGPVVPTAGTKLSVYELDYTVKAMDGGHKFLVYAQAEDYDGTVITTSHKVVFTTSSTATSPGPSPSGLKK